MTEKYCVVLTTCSDPTIKQNLIDQLLKQELAACIQVMPIESHYVWEEKVCQDNEWLLVIKTMAKLYPVVEKTIVEHHDYDVPQVIQLPITDGFNPYLAWISATTQ